MTQPTNNETTFDLNSYQDTIRKFYKFNPSDHTTYSLLGLSEEVGEVHGIVAKNIRDYPVGDALEAIASFENFQASLPKLRKELGDVYFQITSLIDSFGFKVTDIAAENVAKLEDRLLRNAIAGSGDDR